MADIAINKSNAKRYLNGSIPPSSPNTIDGEPVPPSSIVGVGEWVSYLGAKDNVDLGEYFLKASHLKLKTDLATIPTDQGTMYWDQDEETVAIILNGSTTKVGEDIFFQVKNQSGATIPKGTAVRFDGVIGASGRVKIVPFQANGSNPSIYFLGVTYEAIADGADGKALFNGKIRGVDTSAFAVGDILYASPTVEGGFTTTKPVAPNNIISVAAVLSSGANGILLIRPQIGSNINNDEGVKITTPTTGDILQLQASGLWENKSRLAAGLIAGSGTTNYLAKFTAAGTVGNSQVFDNGTNVGIGTDSPTFKLDVNGTARITGALTAGTSSSQTPASIATNNVANQPALTLFKNIFDTETEDIFRVQSFEGGVGVKNVFRVQANGLGYFAGNLLLGTNVNAGFKLDVNGNARISGSGNAVTIFSNNNSLSLGLGYQGVLHGYLGGISSRLEAYSSNGGYVFLNSSSVWVAASDKNRKRNFENYNLGLGAILKLQPKQYHMDFQKNDEVKQVGLIAQEVKEFIPDAYEENQKFIGLNYNSIIVTLINAIKDLKLEIDMIKN